MISGRLARIVDRGRVFAEGRVGLVSAERWSRLERQSLEPRRHLISVAITASTIAALLVCTVIAGLFVEVMLETPFQRLISALFAGAMVGLVIGLAFFVREVHLAMRTVRIAADGDSEAARERATGGVMTP